jgi:TonB-dependent receptor
MEKLIGLIGTAIQSRTAPADYTFSRKMFYAWAVVLILLAQSLMADGTIKGVIVDNQTGDALPGANIVVKGSSIGASTDLDGVYAILNVPAGEQTLEVSYIGYQTMTAVVQVPDGGTARQDFKLQGVAIEGEEVVVTTQALGQKKAINQQLTSNTITNIVASEKIHQLPDFDAATALSRLPGVSIMDGDKVVIRGIEAKFNTVLINGIQVPSTDMEDRSTNLGFISSNLLSGIEVVKALTPDMDANAVGGVINLRLREAPSSLHFDLFSQGAYNTQDKTNNNYRFWASVSNRFFGDKLGVFIQGNADKSDGGQDIAKANFEFLGTGNPSDIEYGQATYQMRSFDFQDQWNVVNTGGASLILDYKLPKGKIVLQNTYAQTLNDNSFFTNTYNLNVTRADYKIIRDKFAKDLLINALQSEYNFGNIKAELSLSHSFTNKDTKLRYGDPGNPMQFYNTNPHPYGYDTSGGAIEFTLERQTLTLDDALNIPIDPTDAPEAQVQGWAVAKEEAFDQHLYNAALDFTIPVTFTNYVSSKFKFGGKFTRSARNNNVEAQFNGTYDTDYYNTTANFFPNHPNLNPQNNPVVFNDLMYSEYKRGENFLGGDYPFQYAYDRDLMDDYMVTSMKGWTPARHYTNSKRDDFNGSEIFAASYLMGSFNIGPRLSLIGGLRYEHYNMNYHANFVYVTHSVYGYGVVVDTLNTADRNDDNVFPNAHLHYKITDWSDIRLAYTKGISRPDYKFILPNIYFEPGGSGQAGNTRLKPTISTNYDAYVSFYNNEIGLFTVGGFYKKLTNIFFESRFYYQNLSYYDVSFPDSALFEAIDAQPPTPSQIITSYLNNPNPAYIRGFELEWQTNFWYLPKPINSLVLNINYSRVWSDMDYQQVRNIPVSVRDTVPPYIWRTHYVTKDTIRNARLLNQGDHILNMAMGVDYKGFSGRLSFNFQGDVITKVGTRPELDEFTGNIYRWDFTIKQQLPFQGLSIQLSGLNIFHNAVKTYQRFRRVVGGEISDYTGSIKYSPRVFQLILRYSY